MSCLVLFIYLKSNTILLMFNHVRGSFVRLEATWNIMCLGFLYNGSNFQGWGFNPKYQKHKNEMYKWNVKLDFLKIYWVPENWYSYFNGFSESCYRQPLPPPSPKNHKKNHKSNKMLWKFIPYTFSLTWRITFIGIIWRL